MVAQVVATSGAAVAAARPWAVDLERTGFGRYRGCCSLSGAPGEVERRRGREGLPGVARWWCQELRRSTPPPSPSRSGAAAEGAEGDIS